MDFFFGMGFTWKDYRMGKWRLDAVWGRWRMTERFDMEMGDENKIVLYSEWINRRNK